MAIPLIVRRFNDVEDAKSCHIFIHQRAGKEKLKQALTDLKGRSILSRSATLPTLPDKVGMVGSLVKIINTHPD